jgi:hypothetical protein
MTATPVLEKSSKQPNNTQLPNIEVYPFNLYGERIDKAKKANEPIACVSITMPNLGDHIRNMAFTVMGRNNPNVGHSYKEQLKEQGLRFDINVDDWAEKDKENDKEKKKRHLQMKLFDEEIVKKLYEFISQIIALEDKTGKKFTMLIHCMQGKQRSPSVGIVCSIMYLMIRGIPKEEINIIQLTKHVINNCYLQNTEGVTPNVRPIYECLKAFDFDLGKSLREVKKGVLESIVDYYIRNYNDKGVMVGVMDLITKLRPHDQQVVLNSMYENEFKINKDLKDTRNDTNTYIKENNQLLANNINLYYNINKEIEEEEKENNNSAKEKTDYEMDREDRILIESLEKIFEELINNNEGSLEETFNTKLNQASEAILKAEYKEDFTEEQINRFIEIVNQNQKVMQEEAANILQFIALLKSNQEAMQEKELNKVKAAFATAVYLKTKSAERLHHR